MYYEAGGKILPLGSQSLCLMGAGLEVTSVTQILVLTPVKYYGSKLGNGFTHGLFSRSVTTSAGQGVDVVVHRLYWGNVGVMPESRRGNAWVTSG